jgi:hypothetical protein
MISYTFGADSFVKRFYHESRGERVSYGPSHLGQFHYLSSNHVHLPGGFPLGERLCPSRKE